MYGLISGSSQIDNNGFIIIYLWGIGSDKLNVLISKSDIINYGNQIVEYSSEFNDQIRKLNALIESINTAWEGADALKYINVMKEKYIVGLDEMKDVLEDYGNYLRKVPDTYSAIDEVFSSKTIDVWGV